MPHEPSSNQTISLTHRASATEVQRDRESLEEQLMRHYRSMVRKLRDEEPVRYRMLLTHGFQITLASLAPDLKPFPRPRPLRYQRRTK